MQLASCRGPCSTVSGARALKCIASPATNQHAVCYSLHAMLRCVEDCMRLAAAGDSAACRKPHSAQPNTAVRMSIAGIEPMPAFAQSKAPRGASMMLKIQVLSAAGGPSHMQCSIASILQMCCCIRCLAKSRTFMRWTFRHSRMVHSCAVVFRERVTTPKKCISDAAADGRL